MSRWKAGLLHLALSALVILTVLGLVLWLWYPPALLPMSGVDRLILLIAIVDLTVGPVLTTIVYRAGKKGLRFDLAVIATLQLALLGYGLSVLSTTRPVYLVGVLDRLELVTAKDIDEEDIALAPPQYRRLSWFGADVVGARMPTDSESRTALAFDGFSGRDLHNQPRYYVPYADVKSELLAKAKPLTSLMERANAEERDILAGALDGRSPDAIRYLAIRSPRGTALMRVDAMSGDLLGPVGIDPWLIEERAP